MNFPRSDVAFPSAPPMFPKIPVRSFKTPPPSLAGSLAIISAAVLAPPSFAQAASTLCPGLAAYLTSFRASPPPITTAAITEIEHCIHSPLTA